MHTLHSFVHAHYHDLRHSAHAAANRARLAWGSDKQQAAAEMEREEGSRVSFRAGTSRFRRPGSRLCHCLLGILFFALMALALVALGVFAAKHNKIDGKGCILYTTKDQLEKKDRLSRGVGCRFTIWGSGVVAVGAGIFMLGYIFKTVYGTSV